MKTSDKQEQFETGSVRDSQDGKARYDLIPKSVLDELAKLYQSGGKSAWWKIGAYGPYSPGARYDLIPSEVLDRDAQLYARGAKHYGERNWEKGQPFSRVYASALRHLIQWRAGDRSEDHLAAVRFNVAAIMFYEEKIKTLELPVTLDDVDTGELVVEEGRTLDQIDADDPGGFGWIPFCREAKREGFTLEDVLDWCKHNSAWNSLNVVHYIKEAWEKA